MSHEQKKPRSKFKFIHKEEGSQNDDEREDSSYGKKSQKAQKNQFYLDLDEKVMSEEEEKEPQDDEDAYLNSDQNEVKVKKGRHKLIVDKAPSQDADDENYETGFKYNKNKKSNFIAEPLEEDPQELLEPYDRVQAPHAEKYSDDEEDERLSRDEEQNQDMDESPNKKSNPFQNIDKPPSRASVQMKTYKSNTHGFENEPTQEQFQFKQKQNDSSEAAPVELDESPVDMNMIDEYKPQSER